MSKLMFHCQKYNGNFKYQQFTCSTASHELIKVMPKRGGSNHKLLTKKGTPTHLLVGDEVELVEEGVVLRQVLVPPPGGRPRGPDDHREAPLLAEYRAAECSPVGPHLHKGTPRDQKNEKCPVHTCRVSQKDFTWVACSHKLRRNGLGQHATVYFYFE